jgi:tetratricopeptide (TPR) repeat protein
MKENRITIKLWSKSILAALIIFSVMAVSALIFNRITGINVNFFLICLVLCVPVILLSPLSAKRFYSAPKPDRIPDFKELEDDFNSTGDDLIMKSFDKTTYEKMYTFDLEWFGSNGIELCKKLISNIEAHNNPELLFQLYFKLSNYYFKDSLYNDAIMSMKRALEIKPEGFIPNFSMAELLEMVGAGGDAIKYYEFALSMLDKNQQSICDYVSKQIQRVKDKGPKKRRAPSGYKWMTG